MTVAISRFFIFIFFLGLVFLQASLHQFLFSLAPLMVVVPLVATWGSDRPFLWIIPWIVAGEVLTTSPPGIITAVALVPPLVQWALKGVRADLSFSFFGTILGTTVLQLAALASMQAVASGMAALPWLLYTEILCCCTILAFVVCTIWMQVKPFYD